MRQFRQLKIELFNKADVGELSQQFKKMNSATSRIQLMSNCLPIWYQDPLTQRGT